MKLPPHMTARVSVSAPVHNPPFQWRRLEKVRKLFLYLKKKFHFKKTKFAPCLFPLH